MSLRSIAFALVALGPLLVASSSHADGLQLAGGLEGGDRSETNFFGAVVELDARLTRHLSARVTARAQYLRQTATGCDFDGKGTGLDATVGLRVDFADRAAEARPFVVGAIGLAGDNIYGDCSPAPTSPYAQPSAAWMGSPMVQVTAGVDFRSMLPPGYSIRIEARASFADFSPSAELAAQFSSTWEYQQFDQEYGLAALLVVQL